MKLSKTELAYMAGFFDGGGCVGIYKSKRCYKGKQKESLVLQCYISQTNPSILERFRDAFGGSIRAETRHLKPNWRVSWTWHIASVKARSFLETIEPYLVLKYEEVELAIRFHLSQSKRSKMRSKFGGPIPFTDEERAIREAQMILLKSLKHKAYKVSDGNNREA